MTSGLQLLFLGTGTSTGVPLIGCECRVCKSSDPRNKHLRSSILLDYDGTRLLVDSTPDLRQQALRENIAGIDAIVYTHCHLDHVAGFDDLRAFCWHHETPLPLYASKETMQVLRTMFPWAFSPDNTYQGYVRPDGRVIDGPFRVGTIGVTPFPVCHASVQTNGYVFQCGGKRIGYACDVKSIPEESLRLLEGLDILVLDCLRRKEHPTHMSLEETLSVMERVRPGQGYLTHMSHDFDYSELAAWLPDFVAPAYDGLSVKI